MPLNLSALLSFALVAFTIELDNEYEHQTIHCTTVRRSVDGKQRGPWLTSFAMYANCLQFLGEAPLSVRELEGLARAATNLDGMRRWGYIRLSPPHEEPNSKRPDQSWLVAPTPSGRIAQEAWRPLPHIIEQRWRERFGSPLLSSFRDVLLKMNQGLDVAYPDFLPIVHYGLFTRIRRAGAHPELPPISEAPLADDAKFTALLSRLLCNFAYDFEADSSLSLAVSANLLRVLDAKGLRNRDLPQLTGLSKESIAMAMGILKKANLVEAGSGASKLVRLNDRGLRAQQHAENLLAKVEQQWTQRFSRPTLQRLREIVEEIAGGPDRESSRLFEGLKPYPDNWRASKPEIKTLPHFPTVLHRGGYPDGS
jgi:hypothetical protein